MQLSGSITHAHVCLDKQIEPIKKKNLIVIEWLSKRQIRVNKQDNQRQSLIQMETFVYGGSAVLLQ